MDLYELLESVDSQESFLNFARELRADRLLETNQSIDQFEQGVNRWENHSIEDFLEAAIAWAYDSNFGLKQGLRDASIWKIFATFLYCGKIYE